MYDELIKRMRNIANSDGNIKSNYIGLALLQAANAIEELLVSCDNFGAAMKDLDQALNEEVEINTALGCNMPVWIPIESRPMDEEERKYYSEFHGYNLTDDEAVIYCCQLPEHGQEVLVCNKWGNIWIDTFDDDPDYGIGFEENGDMDGIVAWMPLPEPPESEGAS